MRIDFFCYTCGKRGYRHYSVTTVPSAFFCSKPCQHEWQKSRVDLVEKNKNPEFSKKVSEGLKRRKALLGDDYHSKATKAKIGATTRQHWEEYDDVTRERMLGVLRTNANNKRVHSSD